MRIGVVARGTHSLHFERSFDTLKRNLSLESRSNIKFRFRVYYYDEPIIARHFFIIIVIFFQNKNQTF